MTTRRKFMLTGASAGLIGAGGFALWPDLAAYEAHAAQQRAVIQSDPAMWDLLRYATLAANGHNTQPWQFALSDDSITIRPDFTRHTHVVDPDDHHLFVSLGCAAENLAIAAAAQGRAGDVRIAEREIAVDLGRSQPAPSMLCDAIPLRQSTRAVYDGRAVSTRDLRLLIDAARQEGVQIAFFTQKQQLEDVLAFVVEGNTAQMADPAFVAELRQWIRFSPSEALEKADGLFAACSGNPVAPGWIGKLAFGQFFRPGPENDKYRDQIRSSAGIAVFVGEKDDPMHWMKVGRSFERFALQATALGIRTAHLNQPIEVPAIRPAFANWLGEPARRPDLVIRFGRAPQLPMSLRRNVSSVVI